MSNRHTFWQHVRNNQNELDLFALWRAYERMTDQIVRSATMLHKLFGNEPRPKSVTFGIWPRDWTIYGD